MIVRRRRAPGRARAARAAARRRRRGSRDAPVLRRRGRARPDARARRRASVLELGPLSDAASAALLEAIAAGAWSRDERRRIAGRRAATRCSSSSSWPTSTSRPAARDALPPALHALLAARLDRLDDRRAVGARARRDRRRRVRARRRSTRSPRHHPRRARAGVRAAGRARPARARRRRRRCASATASCARRPTRRWPSRPARGCTSATPRGSTASAPSVPEADARIGFHLETACRYEREIAGGRAARARAPRRAGGSRRRRGSRAAAATCWARSASSIAPSRCSAPRAEQGAALLPGAACRRSSTPAPRRAPRRSPSARWRRPPRCGLPRVGARAAIERERIRLYRHPERFDVPAAVAVVEQRVAARCRSAGDELGLARAAYLMSDVTWLMGDTGRAPTRRPSGCSPTRGGPAAGSTSRRR